MSVNKLPENLLSFLFGFVATKDSVKHRFARQKHKPIEKIRIHDFWMIRFTCHRWRNVVDRLNDFTLFYCPKTPSQCLVVDKRHSTLKFRVQISDLRESFLVASVKRVSLDWEYKYGMTLSLVPVLVDLLSDNIPHRCKLSLTIQVGAAEERCVENMRRSFAKKYRKFTLENLLIKTVLTDHNQRQRKYSTYCLDYFVRQSKHLLCYFITQNKNLRTLAVDDVVLTQALNDMPPWKCAALSELSIYSQLPKTIVGIPVDLDYNLIPSRFRNVRKLAITSISKSIDLSPLSKLSLLNQLALSFDKIVDPQLATAMQSGFILPIDLSQLSSLSYDLMSIHDPLFIERLLSVAKLPVIIRIQNFFAIPLYTALLCLSRKGKLTLLQDIELRDSDIDANPESLEGVLDALRLLLYQLEQNLQLRTLRLHSLEQWDSTMFCSVPRQLEEVSIDNTIGFPPHLVYKKFKKWMKELVLIAKLSSWRLARIRCKLPRDLTAVRQFYARCVGRDGVSLLRRIGLCDHECLEAIQAPHEAFYQFTFSLLNAMRGISYHSKTLFIELY